MADEIVDDMDEHPTCCALGAYLELTCPDAMVRAHVTQPYLRATLLAMVREGEVTEEEEDGLTGLKATPDDEAEAELEQYEFPQNNASSFPEWRRLDGWVKRLKIAYRNDESRRVTASIPTSPRLASKYVRNACIS